MLNLKVVKGGKETFSSKTNLEQQDDQGHGTMVLVYIFMLFADRDILIYSDSYFASVEAAEQLLRMGLKFTGFIKQATNWFSMRHFQGFPTFKKGETATILSTLEVDEKIHGVVLLCWLDRYWHHFISKIGDA